MEEKAEEKRQSQRQSEHYPGRTHCPHYTGNKRSKTDDSSQGSNDKSYPYAVIHF